MLDTQTNHTEAWITQPIPQFVFEGDIALIAVYIVATIVGIPGNLLAVIYFTRPSLSRGLSTSLYIAVAIADVSICITQLPVLVSLLSHRAQVLFSVTALCTGWRLLFKSLQRFAVFLVLLLSVSRTIGLMWPLRSVRKNAVLGAMYSYLVYIVVEAAGLGSQEGYSWDRTGVYCFENGYQPTSTAYTSLYTASLGIPAIIIFFSFVTSVTAMRRSISSSSGLGITKTSTTRDSTKKQATVTIILFTLTYIICNIPHFINMVAWIVTMSLPGCSQSNSCYPGPVYNNPFMYWFSWNISEVLSVLVNCACNPVIYYFRITKFRDWIIHVFLPGGRTVVSDYSMGSFRLYDPPNRWGKRRKMIRKHTTDEILAQSLKRHEPSCVTNETDDVETVVTDNVISTMGEHDGGKTYCVPLPDLNKGELEIESDSLKTDLVPKPENEGPKVPLVKIV